jgi:thioredoxin 1
MRRILFAFTALFALVATGALAQFAEFEKTRFQSLINGNTPVVLHTHEWWCPTCRVQANVLERLKKEPKFAGIALVRASAGSDRETLAPLKVTSRSIIVVFRNGKQVGRLDWVTDEAQIRALLEKASG